MRIFVYSDGVLRELFGGKQFRDVSSLDERNRVADRLTESYAARIELDRRVPEQLAIAVRLLLFKYYRVFVSGLACILEHHDVPGDSLIVRQGVRSLGGIEKARQIVLPCEYSLAGAWYVMLTGLRGDFDETDIGVEGTRFLVLTSGAGKLEREIWGHVAEHLDRPYHLGRMPRRLPMPLKRAFSRDAQRRRIDAEFAELAGLLPRFMLLLLRQMVRSAYELLRMTPAEVVVAFQQSSPVGATLSYAAGLCGKLRVDLVHAATFGENYKHTPSAFNLVFGPASAEVFRSPDSIACGETIGIGAPKFDRFFTTPLTRKPWDDSVLFLPSYSTKQGRDLDQQTIMQALAALLEEFPEVRITIKHHPAAKNAYAEAVLSAHPRVTDKLEADLLQEIDAHDVVVVMPWSTSGLEVTARARCLVRMNIPPTPDWYGYARSGYGRDASDYEELRAAFREFRTAKGGDERARGELLDRHFANPGTAGAKIAELLVDLGASASSSRVE